MQSLRKFGDWLKEGAKLPWGAVAEQGIEAIAATSDLSETWQEAAPKIAKLENLDRLDSFFKLFESPVTQLAVSGLPFVSVGIGLLRLYWDVTKTKPTFESSVALAAQMAYLESLGGVLARADEGTKETLKAVRLSAVFERQLKKSDEKSDQITLTKTRAKKMLTQLRRSELVEVFDEALGELLKAAGLKDWQVNMLVDQVAWGTPKYFHGVVAELKDEVEPLAEFLRSNGLPVQEKFDSIEDYLAEKIEPLPTQTVFDEVNVTFGKLYVPLMVQPLDISGKKTYESPIDIHAWAEKLLEQSEPRKVGFIEGEAGRGKSVFCRMFAAMVRLELYPAFIPILIRLREVGCLESNLTQTLETHLQALDFVQSDSGWLTDKNTRFLLIFDGFDELLLQGREGGGLKELVQQLGDFQKNSHHQCLVTGRPLALQGVDRMLSQTKNLVRVRLKPMANAQRDEWLGNWAKLFGEVEAQDFKAFLTACPKDISEQLAREPLLLYLLGRLHRERHLNADMFAGAEGMQAKVRVYDESVKWVLERQRQEVSEQIPGLVAEDLRQVLQAAALCVVQSGNETAKLAMLKSRFTDGANPVAELLKQARAETEKTEDKALNNLLTAFYLKPGEGDRSGSVEFAHKSFGEFLFAERLKVAFDGWVDLDERGRPRLSATEVGWQIYDLLGYGLLSSESFIYIRWISFSIESFDTENLFQRLHRFYGKWCDGGYIDETPSENLPQRKMMQLKNADIVKGLRQVDIYAGLNVLALLVGLHRDSKQKTRNSVQAQLTFHPCSKPNERDSDPRKLSRIIKYSQGAGVNPFTTKFLLAGANLSDADLSGIDFSNTYLNKTNFYRTQLQHSSFAGANLADATLKQANLSESYMSSAFLQRANLSRTKIFCADFTGADLSHANLSWVNLSPPDGEVDDFAYVCFDYAIFTEANCKGSNFIRSSFIGAEFTSANLDKAILSGSDLTLADISNSDCVGADFGKANLRGANLSGSKFDDANFDNIIFDEETNWEGVKGLETAKNIPEALKQQLGLT